MRRRRILRIPTPFSRSAAAAGDDVTPGATPVLPIRPSRLNDTFRALKHRNYRLFYFGQAISLSGTWMQTIAQAWLVLEITDSRVALGTVTLLQFLPITLFVLVAGVIADRVPKRRFIVATQCLAMAQAATLAVLVFTDQIQLWHVYVLAFTLGLSNAFDMPARQAFAIELVGKEDLLNAVALNSGLFNGARLVGPAIGGLVIAAAGVEVAFLINAVSFVPVLIGLMLMDTGALHQVDRSGSPRASPLTEFREGLSYVLRTPACMMIMLLIAIIGTFGYNFTVFLPLIARYVLHEGSAALGFLTAAVGLGALISALFLAGNRKASLRTIFIGGAFFSLLLGAVALSQNLYLTLGFLVMLGLANTAFAATANTSLQIATPDHLRGRVMAIYMLLFAGSTPIGGFLTGFMAEHLGTRTAVGVLSGMCCLGIVLGLLYYTTHRSEIARTADAGRLVVAASD
ncbi:MAG: MFS transporter [Dehalococcoidia bacterium]